MNVMAKTLTPMPMGSISFLTIIHFRNGISSIEITVSTTIQKKIVTLQVVEENFDVHPENW
jgi:hypothetical protein